jgi:hypothetical protein
MAKINLNELVKAIDVVKEMDQKTAETHINEIFTEQPHMMGSVLTLKKIGYQQAQIQVLLNILLVTHLALKFSGVRIKQVSEAELKAHMMAYADYFKLLEEQGPAWQDKQQKYADGHPENYLMAFVNNTMYEAGFTKMEPGKGKFLVMAGTNIVNCVAGAPSLKIML